MTTTKTAQPRRRLLALACTLPLLAAAGCGSGDEDTPDSPASTTTSSASSAPSSSVSPTTPSSDDGKSSSSQDAAAPNPTPPGGSDPAGQGEPQPAASPEEEQQPAQSAQNTGQRRGEGDPDYNCRNRSAPPLNNTTLPLAGGGSFNYTLKANQYDPCKALSWIHVAGNQDGPKEAVLLYHNGNPVNSPAPRLMAQVTGIQRVGDNAVRVTYRTADGESGSVTTTATGGGVQETANTLPAAADQAAPRLAGAHS